MTAYPRAREEAVNRYGSFDPDTPRLRTAFVAGAQWERMRTRTPEELETVAAALLELFWQTTITLEDLGEAGRKDWRHKARTILDAAREAS